MKYQVEIEEVLRKVVEIDAESADEAETQIGGSKTYICRYFLQHYYTGTYKMGFIYQLTLIAIINLFIFVVGANVPSAFLHPNKIYP